MKIVKVRITTLISLIIITLLGFILKFHTGPLQQWCNNNAAGIFYEIFWILFSFLLFPSFKTINRAPIIVFIITIILEFIQLWHPLFLEKFRGYFIGRTLIGTSFSWLDIVHYVFGCLLGWLLLKGIISIHIKKKWFG